MPQSAELTRFYVMYNNWLRIGAPEYRPFSRKDGLCMAIRRIGSTSAMLVELKEQFKAAYGNAITPFNRSGMTLGDENLLGLCYCNPHRVNWVREHCNP